MLEKPDKKRKIDQPTIDALENLWKSLEKHKVSIKSANLKLAAIQNEDSELTLVYLRIEFLDKIPKKREFERIDYEKLLLVKKSMRINEAKKLIDDIYKHYTVNIESISEIKVEARLRGPTHFHSEQASILKREYPLLYFEGNILTPRKDLKTEIPIKKELLYFPTMDEAIRTLLDLNVGLEQMYGIKIVVPDFRARMSRLHIDGKHIGIEVSPRSLSQNDLIVKMYVRGNKDAISSQNLEIQEGMTSFSCDFEPEYVDAILFSIPDGDVVDRRLFTSFKLFSSKEVVVDDIESRLLQIIENGEGRTTEFKRTLSSNEGEYLESIVSFANSDGGLLIIGVDDNCNVIGYNNESKDTIRNRISSLCEPPIEVEIRTNVLVREKPLTVIEVNEGNDKPYNLRGRGIYIRRGASDYRVSRTELDQIYNSKPRKSILGLFK